MTELIRVMRISVQDPVMACPPRFGRDKGYNFSQEEKGKQEEFDM